MTDDLLVVQSLGAVASTYNIFRSKAHELVDGVWALCFDEHV